MSSPVPIVPLVPLVPRGKVTKKKRPNFRPVSALKLTKPSQKSTTKKSSSSKETERKRKQSIVSPSVGGGEPSDEPAEGEASKKRQATETQQDSQSEEDPARTSAAIVVVTDRSLPVDENKDILEKLLAENPDGVQRLSSFCSRFKGPKIDRTELAAAAPTQNNNTIHPPNSPNKKKAPAESTGAPVVQIIDGEIVLQESSLMFPGQRRTVQEVEDEFQDVVEEDGQTTVVGASYNSFVTRKGPQHWSVDETKRFYDALRQLGTDFCSMEAFFDDRTRKQLKRKYQSELSKHPRLVEMALDPRFQMEIDLSVFNVVVDPKAIEAAANEEPPLYEPTDVVKPPQDREDPNSTAEKSSEPLWQEGQVVVEEDAEEEARAAATQQQQEQSNIWPTLEEPENQQEPNEMGGGVDYPEPSMDDFFHEHDPAQPVVVEPSAEPEMPSISLVPKQSNAKSKRPKFRSAARKRK